MPPEKKPHPAQEWISVTHSVLPKDAPHPRVTREYFETDLEDKGWSEVKNSGSDSPQPTDLAAKSDSKAGA